MPDSSETQPDRTHHFGLIWCSDHLWPSYQQALLDTFSQPEEQWTVIDATKGELARDWTHLSGFLVGGSEHSVNDQRLSWLPDLFTLLRRCQQDQTPVVGICFGAQALAAALGGAVIKNPSQQFAYRVESIVLEPALASWFDARQCPAPMLVESHGDCISKLPPHAQHLAHSDTARHEIFTVGNSMIGVQGHPEITIKQAIDEVTPMHLKAGVIDQAQADQASQQLRATSPEIAGAVKLCQQVLKNERA